MLELAHAHDIARAAARAGAATVVERRRDVGSVRTKSSATDIVTDSDIASGVSVVREILAADPSARFVVEEPEVYELAGATQGDVDDDEVWVIDPIDGTTSFLHGFPCYSVSVALMRSGQPVAGAVLNIPAEELFSAAQGLGAFLDGERISCSETASLGQALLVTGFPYDRGALLDRQLATLGAFLRAPAHGIRRDGSAAVDCCHVACGRADGFWEFGLQPYDVGAGAIILREAGAVVTGIDGEHWSAGSSGIIAANPVLHPLVADVVLAGAR